MLTHKIVDCIIVGCQIILAPIRNQWFYWMLLCMIFSKGRYRSTSSIILILNWAFRSLGDVIDQYPSFFKLIDKSLNKTVSWRLFDSLIVSLNYLAEIVSDWYPVCIISNIIIDPLYINIATCTCIFYNVTKLLPIIHFYFNMDNCEQYFPEYITALNSKIRKVEYICLETDFWRVWAKLQFIIEIGTLLYYVTCFVILGKEKSSYYTRAVSNQTVLQNFKLYSRYRIRILCIISMILSFTIIPLGFLDIYSSGSFHLELLRNLLKYFSYLIMYFDRILDYNFGDDNNVENTKIKENKKIKRNLSNNPRSISLYNQSDIGSSPTYLNGRIKDYIFYNPENDENSENEKSNINGENENSYIKHNVFYKNINTSSVISPISADEYYSLLNPNKSSHVLDFGSPLQSSNSERKKLNKLENGEEEELNNSIKFRPEINDIPSTSEQLDETGKELKTINMHLTLPPFRSLKNNNMDNKILNKGLDTFTEVSENSSLNSKGSQNKDISTTSFYFNNIPTSKTQPVNFKSTPTSLYESSKFSINTNTNIINLPSLHINNTNNNINNNTINNINNNFNNNSNNNINSNINSNNINNNNINNNTNNNYNNNNNNNNNTNHMVHSHNNSNGNDISLTTESTVSSFLRYTTNSPSPRFMDRSTDKLIDYNNSGIFEDDDSINNIRNVNRMLQKMSSLQVNDGYYEVKKKGKKKNYNYLFN